MCVWGHEYMMVEDTSGGEYMWGRHVRCLTMIQLGLRADHTHQIFILLGVSLSFANTLAMKKCKRHVAPACEGVGQREGQWSPTSVAERRPSRLWTICHLWPPHASAEHASIKCNASVLPPAQAAHHIQDPERAVQWRHRPPLHIHL